MAKQVALITGASSGIGLELARLFAADGYDLVLVARRESALNALAGELTSSHACQVRALPADLADPAAPASLFRELTDGEIDVDVVVNNAGFGAEGDFAELPVDQQVNMVQVNIAALTHLTRLFVPKMIERGRGGVLNVGSTAAFQPGPFMAIYYASKAYVLSFTEALAEELAGTGVKVSCLCPGATKTEFFEQARMEDSLLVKMGTMDAAKVAKAGYRGFKSGKVIVIPGLKNRLGAMAVRFVPRSLVRKITARLNHT